MEKETKMSVYEVGYLLVPSIAEENVGGEVTKLKDILAENGAQFISDEYPKLIDLAYEMSRNISNKKTKFATGYFGWVKFEMSAEGVLKSKDALDNNESIIRFLLIKTVRESTMAPKRSYKQEGSKRRTKVSADNSAPEEEQSIDEETIDQDIEALVVE